jgi:aquaporin related protein
MIACLGEFVGTTMFIFLGLGCVKTAQDAQTASQLQTSTTLSNQTLIFIAVGMGFSLLVTAWVFYRITGGLFVRICVLYSGVKEN